MKDENKHAYLIMVHKNGYVLEKLLKQLDDKQNDIYIHVDKKCTNFAWPKYKKIVSKSNLFKTKTRVDVVWGDYSQIKAELVLVKEAHNRRNYQYYHLLSGQDLALKNQKKIHEFFNKNEGKIFISSKRIAQPSNIKWNFSHSVYSRASVKRIFVRRSICKLKVIRKILGFLDKLYAYFQSKILKRNWINSKGIQLSYGANWFSIPESIVELILNNQDKIEYYFKNSMCADELFIQSILEENNISVENNDLLLVDWKRGKDAHPYIWKSKDERQILTSNKLFARKFDENIDKQIIDKIYETVINDM